LEDPFGDLRTAFKNQKTSFGGLLRTAFDPSQKHPNPKKVHKKSTKRAATF
jgi:hypothetical protein